MAPMTRLTGGLEFSRMSSNGSLDLWRNLKAKVNSAMGRGGGFTASEPPMKTCQNRVILVHINPGLRESSHEAYLRSIGFVGGHLPCRRAADAAFDHLIAALPCGVVMAEQCDDLAFDEQHEPGVLQWLAAGPDTTLLREQFVCGELPPRECEPVFSIAGNRQY
jgi:hypothetical protein